MINSAVLLRLLLFWLFFMPQIFWSQMQEGNSVLPDHPLANTVQDRFLPPLGYQWIQERPGSFGQYLEQVPLLPEGTPVHDYQRKPIEKQHLHAAVMDIDVGTRDLQQCADAWIRLYAEYLWENKRFDDIAFQFTSGQKMSWKDYRNGIRTIETGDSVRFVHRGKPDESYQNFRKYLDLIFQYAGTISLDQESVRVASDRDIRVGDFLITPGTPGHCVIIVGRAQDAKGKRLYLLAESFMPAQDIHILKNPGNPKISPWYEIKSNAPQTVPAKYIFRPTSVKRFYQLYQQR